MKIFKILLSVTIALALSVLGANVLSPLVGIKPILIGSFLFAANFVPVNGVLPILIFTAPGGIGAVFTQNIPFLPQDLAWNDGANPLTNLRISTAKDGVLHDWNAAAIAAMNGYMHVGPLAANEVAMKLATGHSVKNVTITGTTSAAGAINFFAHSDNQGNSGPVIPYRSQMDTVIALTPTVFQNFCALFIPTMAAGTDYADITFSDGHIDRYETEDLLSISSSYQQVGGLIINNITQLIKRVSLRCAANTPVYTLRFLIPGQRA